MDRNEFDCQCEKRCLFVLFSSIRLPPIKYHYGDEEDFFRICIQDAPISTNDHYSPRGNKHGGGGGNTQRLKIQTPTLLLLLFK